jgi:threonine/homoserine/homoserine lactone efflux protein
MPAMDPTSVDRAPFSVYRRAIMLDASFLPNLLFVTTSAAILAVPGPTNALLAAAGAALGFRSSLKLVPAVLAAYLGAILAWGCLLTPAIAFWPPLAPLLRLACALFLAAIAIRLWRRTTGPSTDPTSMITTRRITLVTLLNPKAFLFAAGVFPPAAFSQPDVFSSAGLAFAAPLVPIALIWIAFGAALAGAGNRIPLRTINRTAAILLAFFAATIGVPAVI